MVVERKDILSFLPCSNSIFYFLFANHRCPHIDAVRDQYRSCAIVIAEVTTLSIGDLISNETCVLGASFWNFVKLFAWVCFTKLLVLSMAHSAHCFNESNEAEKGQRKSINQGGWNP